MTYEEEKKAFLKHKLKQLKKKREQTEKSRTKRKSKERVK